jgi:predicted DNA-binding antitoxin AbrB/MazE fold protein
MKDSRWFSWRLEMSQIEAVFRHGVFEPLGPVDLKEEQRVRLSIEPTDTETLEAWRECARELRDAIYKRRGFLPDSTPGIAEDRMR